MTVSKRESRLRRWAKKLGGCLRNYHPHRKYKSSYMDMETTRSPINHRHNAPRQRNALIGWREQRPKKSTSSSSNATDTGAKRALPSSGRLRVLTPQDLPTDETIRFVNASMHSLVGGRQGAQTPRYVGRISYRTAREAEAAQTTIIQRPTHQGPRPIEGPRHFQYPRAPSAVLSWQESFQVQRAVSREISQPPASSGRHDSAADLTVRPLKIRPSQVTPSASGQTSVGNNSVLTSTKPRASARAECYNLQRSSLPAQPTHFMTATNPNGRLEPVKGWDKDWDKPLQYRIGDSKGLWKTASHRLLVRNKDSIRRLDAEKALGEKMKQRLEMSTVHDPQMRSIQSIEEMAEEDRRAGEEWNGIATQLAIEAQSPDVQEVHSFSYRHQRRPAVSSSIECYRSSRCGIETLFHGYEGLLFTVMCEVKRRKEGRAHPGSHWGRTA
ncbi:hypothetical protein BDW02DRAFT_646206 [Decorospora gaudefroyi]|uniref:Uncharacterized protein n=1 Tax=Decorospora gaudefroyi TaxID=184978 RepID=A0A6A5KRW6_9PLEO|nr:hypothetical protein BDW02DRAFT_646206 [Decorospora gaudefroyi]